MRFLHSVLLTLLISACSQQEYVYEKLSADRTWFSAQPALMNMARLRKSYSGEFVKWDSPLRDGNATHYQLVSDGGAQIKARVFLDGAEKRSGYLNTVIKKSLILYSKGNVFVASEVITIAFQNSSVIELYYNYGTGLLKGGIIFENGIAKGFIDGRNKGRSNRLTCYSVSIPYFIEVGGNTYYKGTDTYTFCAFTIDANSYNEQMLTSDVPGVGGGIVDQSPSMPGYGVDQSVGKLCSSITFKQVGNSFTAEVSGLGLTAINFANNTVINIEFGVSCIEIPSYNLKDRFEASDAFTNAFNRARDEIASLLNSGQLAPNSIAIEIKFKSLILEYLPPGAAFSRGTCSGSIPKNTADYGC